MLERVSRDYHVRRQQTAALQACGAV